MKWFVLSDLHGSAYYCRRALEAFDAEGADRILLLGDVLYHGPRNELPGCYEPKSVTELLNERKNSISCVRGNCDAEVDQMVLDFPIMADYALIDLGNRIMYATHGHIFNINNPLPIEKGDVLIYGHTHVPLFEERDGVFYMNPGSLTMPKMGSYHGYMLIEGSRFIWKDIDGSIKDEHIL